jgi:hypothetical protein
MLLYLLYLVLKRTKLKAETRREIIGLTICGLFVLWLASVFISR